MAASLDRWGTSLAIDGVKLDELALLGRTLAGLLAFLFCWIDCNFWEGGEVIAGIGDKRLLVVARV